jgi:hypothetical protein
MAARLAKAMEAVGYDVWWDDELPPHQSYGDVITDKITSAKAAVVLWSASSAKSEWVRAEADLARNQHKLIQTALEQVAPPLPFNQIQYAQLGDWRGEDEHPGWRKVKVSLAELCGSTSPRTAAPMPSEVSPSAPTKSPTSSRAPIFAAIAVVGLVLIGAAWWLMRPASRSPGPNSENLAAVWNAPATQSVARGVAIVPNDLPLGSRPDMVFADSSSRLLQAQEVASLSPAMLKVAWGEILARNGFRFRDPLIFRYFSRFSWYQPNTDQLQLNPIERKNIALLRQAEARYQ